MEKEIKTPKNNWWYGFWYLILSFVKKIFKIIQGGMGLGVSGYRLANAVSKNGGLGTVSCVAVEILLIRELQDGDLRGDIRRGLAHFPNQTIANKIIDKYYVKGGKPKDVPYKGVPFLSVDPPQSLIELIVAGSYTFVWLAKEGHGNPVSMNLLEKVNMPLMYAIFGAMLAKVDYLTMGAGIPIKIPAVLEAFSKWEIATYPIPIISKDGRKLERVMSFDSKSFFGGKTFELKKPKFIPIISANALAEKFVKDLPKGSIYGFVVEEPTAGGHNAGPRNKNTYTEKDYVDYEKLSKLGYPFWIAGSYFSREKLNLALELGAEGTQIGTAFALSEESGIDPELKRKLRKLGFNGQLSIKTDMRASPTGYPFKVAQVDGTISEKSIYESRERVCSQGGLIVPYEKETAKKNEDGKEIISIGYRCPSEPENKYLKKSGKIEDTKDRNCLCNQLLSAIGKGDSSEPPIITLGDDTSFLKKLMKNENDSYAVKDIFRYLNPTWIQRLKNIFWEIYEKHYQHKNS